MAQQTKIADKTAAAARDGHLHHKILRLEVSGGFLDGLRFDFIDGLNCVIGGRGTGKTTVLEFLRYALNAMPDPREASAQHKQLDRLIQGNLGDGRLKAMIQTKEGLVYNIERAAGEDAQISDDLGLPTEFPLDGVINIEVYSQNQIEEIANNPHFQLDIIDKFKRREIAESQNQIRALNRELSANAGEILKLKGEIVELSEGQSEIKLIEAKLKTFPRMKGQEGDLFQNEIAKKGVRDKEKRFVTQLAAYLGNVLRSVEGAREEFKTKSASISKLLEAEPADAPNAEIFGRIKKTFAQRSAAALSGMATTGQSIDQLQAEVTALHAELDKAHRLQEVQYQELLKKNEADKGRAQEQNQLQKRYNELVERRKELEERKKALQSKIDERKALLKSLSELRDERWKWRDGVASALNADLEPELRIKVEPCGDRTAYRDLLKEALRGTRTWYSSLVDKIAISIPPAEFAAIIQASGSEALVERLDIDEEKADWLVTQLRDTERIYELETVEVEDKPTIQLKDGEYKDSSALSIGQKCTTILPILLLGSANPLLVDQPEDNLDNNFIYKTVVTRIQKTKNERQMIFVTHNPNIPVLGGAARVFVMESDGAKASLRAQGTVDEVRQDIETFLEGGREAFAKRKDIYGIR